MRLRILRKEFNSHSTGLEHQHDRRFIVWNTNMAAVTSCENTLYRIGFNVDIKKLYGVV